MLGVQQDHPVNSLFGGQGAGGGSTLRLHGHGHHLGNRKCDKDGNFNFLGQEDELLTGDENRNQLRPRLQNLPGREPLLPLAHFSAVPMSPLSRLPCWSPLEPLPEIEVGEESCGRVPPEGAEGKTEEETGRAGGEEEEEEAEAEADRDGEEDQAVDEDEDWEESGSEFEFSYRSSSGSSLSMEGEDGQLRQEGDEQPEEGIRPGPRGSSGDGQSLSEMKKAQDEEVSSDSDSDTDLCPDLPELMEAVWTLQDREKFKAKEMERHQVQLTMYRRLALIRWVRSLQGRVQEQQNRLQSSFDIILTHRKELLRMGAATGTPNTAVSQS